MAIRGGYAPPGVYTESVFDSPTTQNNPTGRIPLLIGAGAETFSVKAISLVRGSSSTIDQQIVEEDTEGRIVLSQLPNGSYVLGGYNGVDRQVRARQWPLVTGDGTGTTAISPSSVTATVNGQQIVVLSIDGEEGLINLSQAPKEGDDVRISYFFNRTDTFVSNEDASAQVSPTATELFAGTGDFEITGQSNTLILTVDGVASVITLPIKGDGISREDHLASVVSRINASGAATSQTLSASAYTNNLGTLNLKLSAQGSILVGAGSSNQALGITQGQTGSARNAVFYTSYSPIVDGSNAGAVTTNPSDVTVLVDGVAVTPISVDGATGAITLSSAPKVGQEVSISYSFNSFRDFFDYIPSRDVTSIERVGITPEGGGASGLYFEGSSWVLKDDKIYWGTFASVSDGSIQNGEINFGGTQVTALLKDERIFMAECSNVTDTTTIPQRTLPNVFRLPFQPMDGTGTATPSSRTDLITVRTGVSISDALERDPVVVTRVNPTDSTITLSRSVPFGHKVFATGYYNNIQDEYESAGGGYTLTVESVGASNQGTYSISNGGLPLKAVTFEGKGSDLALTELAFPSGTEILSDAHLSVGTPVDESVTVTLSDFEPTPAVFTLPYAAPYSITDTTSASLTIDVDNGVNKAKSVLFDAPAGNTNEGFFTRVVSEPLPYTPESDNAHLGNIDGDLFFKIDGKDISVATGALVNATASDIVSAINTASQAVAASYTAMTPMGALSIVAGESDLLSIRYRSSVKDAQIDITIADGAYASLELLVDQIQTKIDAAIVVLGQGDAALADIAIEVSNFSGHLVFSLTDLANGDSYGYLEFISQADPTDDFARIAGIDTGISDGTQTKFGIVPVARVASTDILGNGNLAEPHKDRIVLRNRAVIGNDYFPPVELGVEIVGGSILSESGLSAQTVLAPRKAIVEAPSLLLRAGWAEQSTVTSSPAVIFYDGTDPNYPANNVLNLDVSGTLISVEFTASDTGLLTDLFSAGGSVSAQLVAAGLSVQIEGANLRIIGGATELDYISVLEGSANDLFNLSAGSVRAPRLVSAVALSSALMNAGDYASNVAYIISDSAAVTGFVADGIAYTTTDETGFSYVSFESLTAGSSSVINFTGGSSITTVGSGLGITTASGAVGEVAYQGFFVTSTNPLGSGSANTSTLNNGDGQDGVIGQTYVDDVTGFSFTLLPRAGSQPYPTGVNATLSFKVGNRVTTNANIPVNVVPGVQIIVSNTVGTFIGDTALVETYAKGGPEPDNGQEYFLDLTRRKATYNTGVFTRLSDVISAYGEISPQNPLSLGAYLAFLNGASSIALKQIPLDAGQTEPSIEQMGQALVDVEGEIRNGLSPSVIIPLLPASSTLLSDISLHCDVQSSLRYRSERTAIVGCSAGTTPEQASALAQGVKNSRVRLVYPDILSISVTSTQGVTENFIVDGRYMAVAVACATTKSTIDAATPWTRSVIVGFNGLLRTLDAVDANRTANRGVTILQQQGATLNIRHGLTTDMSSVLSKTPTVVQIADEVHLRARNLLNTYIGQKYLPTVVGQIEGRVNMMFKDLVKEQIVDSYTNLSVVPDPEDPTGLLVEVYYKPIFPLLYIQFTFNVRSSV